MASAIASRAHRTLGVHARAQRSLGDTCRCMTTEDTSTRRCLPIHGWHRRCLNWPTTPRTATERTITGFAQRTVLSTSPDVAQSAKPRSRSLRAGASAIELIRPMLGLGDWVSVVEPKVPAHSGQHGAVLLAVR